MKDNVIEGFTFLKEKQSNKSSCTVEELATHTGWKKSSISSYISKRWFGFIKRKAKGEYICKGLPKSIQEFRNIHTQKLIPKEEPPMLLKKARQFSLVAVANYNNPTLEFKTYSYIVNIIIAWTALFHAIFEKQGVIPYYKNKENNYLLINEEKQAWDISHCIKEYWKDNNNPIRKNLLFLIGLRNEIEHRSLPIIDMITAGHCQSALTNFEDLLVSNFGEQYSLAVTLSISLQLSSVSIDARNKALKEFQKKNYKAVRNYIDNFESDLSSDILESQNYRIRLFLLPKISNSLSSSDLCLDFVKLDPNNPEHRQQLQHVIAIKNTSKSMYQLKPKHVIAQVNKNSAIKLNQHLHVKAWKFYKIRGQKNEKHQDNLYCGWIDGYDDYLYSADWVSFLIKKLNNAEEYNKLLAFKIELKNS